MGCSICKIVGSQTIHTDRQREKEEIKRERNGGQTFLRIIMIKMLKDKKDIIKNTKKKSTVIYSQETKQPKITNFKKEEKYSHGSGYF